MMEYPYRTLLNKHGGVGNREASYRDKYEYHRKVTREFMESTEFDKHLTNLIEWKSLNEDVLDIKENESLKSHIGKLVTAVREMKGFQDDFSEAIYNIRDHYFKIKQAFENHEKLLLKQNEEIKYDLLELEEYLVASGLLDPREIKIDELEAMRMKRALNIFDDLCVVFQPELISPKHQNYIKAIEKTFKPKRIWTTEEHNNEMLRSGIGHGLSSLVDMAYSQNLDINDKDYMNESFKKAVQGDNKDKVLINATYTKIWKDTYNHMKDILEKFIAPNISQCSPIESMCLISAYNRMGFSDRKSVV